MLQPVWKIVWIFLNKLKIEIPYDPVASLLDIFKENRNTNLKRYMHFWL